MKNQNSIITRLKLILCIGLVLILSQSCKKNWLDAKPDKSLITPTSIQDYQAVLDNSEVFNTNYPGLNEVGSDNYTVTLANWQSSGSALERNCYTWSSDIYDAEKVNFDWTFSYKRILYSNIVIEGLPKISVTNSNEKDWNNVKGSALFYRAYSYYILTQLFCKPYKGESANNELGLPLRLSSDVNVKIKRSTIKETYSQIITDLNTALDLLPTAATYLTRPSKNAVYALLARIYLSIGDFDNAIINSTASLAISKTLIDYNTLKTTATLPFVRFNSEIIFHCEASTYSILSKNYFNVDTELYNTYLNDDLRKILFFTFIGPDVKFKGNYSGSNAFFSGLAVNEMFLIRAECFARKGKISEAIGDLNFLLKTRWKKNIDDSTTYVDITASNQLEALHKILLERRKELLFRELRWSDLRRLNSEKDFAITLKRNLDGQLYQLTPNDNKYTLTIPPDEVRLSGIEQNSRGLTK